MAATPGSCHLHRLRRINACGTALTPMMGTLRFAHPTNRACNV
jgi:hypothetical protein